MNTIWALFAFFALISLLAIIFWIIPWMQQIRNLPESEKRKIFKKPIIHFTILAIIVISPATAVYFYSHQNTWKSEYYLSQKTHQRQIKIQEIRQLVQKIESKIQHEGKLQGESIKSEKQDLLMLSRAYLVLNELIKAEQIMDKIYTKYGAINSGFLNQYIELAASNNQGSLLGKPEKLLLEALKLDPQNYNLRLIQSYLFLQKKHPLKALSILNKLKSDAPEESTIIQYNISQAIKKAQESLKDKDE